MFFLAGYEDRNCDFMTTQVETEETGSPVDGEMLGKSINLS